MQQQATGKTKVEAVIARGQLEGAQLHENTRRELNVIQPMVDSETNLVQRNRQDPLQTSEFRTPILGFDGFAKASSRIQQVSNGQYGEDVSFACRLFSGSQGDVDWLFVADGHGGSGHKTALAARELFRARWEALAAALCDLSGERKFGEAMEAMQERGYTEVLSKVERDAEDQGWSGCTVTQMLMVTTASGRRIVYTSNMGDSPAAVMTFGDDAPKVYQTSCLHNWEDEAEMRRYVKHVWATRAQARDAGEPYEHIQPSNVCYHIFNLTGSGALIEDMAGNQPVWDASARQFVRGDAMPIVMWQYPEIRSDNDELLGWDVLLDEQAARHVTEKAQLVYGKSCIGGTQAEASKAILVSGPDAEPFQALMPNKNWGSSVLLGPLTRGCQSTRGIADRRERRQCFTSDQASFMALELGPNEEAIQVVMSDGLGDMVGLQDLAEHLGEVLRTGSWRCDDVSGHLLAARALEYMRAKPYVQCRDVDGEARPTHDDCSIGLAYLPSGEVKSSADEAQVQGSLVPGPSKSAEGSTRAWVQHILQHATQQVIIDRYGFLKLIAIDPLSAWPIGLIGALWWLLSQRGRFALPKPTSHDST